jgi:hypothetical protein
MNLRESFLLSMRELTKLPLAPRSRLIRPSARYVTFAARDEPTLTCLPLHSIATMSGGVRRVVRSMKNRCWSPNGTVLVASFTTEYNLSLSDTFMRNVPAKLHDELFCAPVGTANAARKIRMNNFTIRCHPVPGVGPAHVDRW